MKLLSISLAVAAGLQHALALDLDTTSLDSIRSASSTLAYGLMSAYQNNQSSTAATVVGTLPSPAYWWEAGAAWGALVDYWAYTNDTSYNPTVTQALMAQVGPDNNYMPPAYYSSLGNDDQAFWALAVLNALESGYPQTNSSAPSWLELAENVFNSMVPRWNTTQCNGGLKWQIFPFDAGYDYKNSISNGGFFQIAARLARYTGNSTYSDWAETIWDWSSGIGLIASNYDVYDGTSDLTNCSSINHLQWTYSSGIWVLGSATMYNYTNGSSLWEDRTTGLLDSASATFFNYYSNASNVMVEVACEQYDTCDYDQRSFKGYLARWLAKTTVVAPFTAATIMPLLTTSAQAAAQACTGTVDGSDTVCGAKWYVDGYDGNYGVGQEMSALEVTQALLIGNAPTLQNIEDVKVDTASTTTLSSTTSSSARTTSAKRTSASTTLALTTLASTTSAPTTTTSTTSSTPEATKHSDATEGFRVGSTTFAAVMSGFVLCLLGLR